MLPSHLTLVAHAPWHRQGDKPVGRARLLAALDEAVELLEREPHLSFTLDGQVAMLEDYLELRPAMEPRVRELVRSGRLRIGPFFTQADTLMVPGEAVMRNLAYGIRRAEALGSSMRLGYMPEQHGHAAQMPQLLRLFAIDSAVLWQDSPPAPPGTPPHAFLWVAPDGSQVTAVWLPGWLPDAAEVLRSRPLECETAAGHPDSPAGPPDSIEDRVYGELPSAALAPVPAGVASCRIRHKQAAARATTLLLRYAEPLCAWAAIGGLSPPRELLERAWRLLLLNQAHDSAAGRGSDEVYEDIKGRYHLAEQLAATVCEQVLAALLPEVPEVPDQHPPTLLAYHPGPAASTLLVEVEVPRGLVGGMIARGPDGIGHPVQALPDRDASRPTRRVLIAAGPAVAAGMVPIWLRPGQPSAELPRAWAIEGVIAAGPLRVTAQADGTVLIEDETSATGPVVANDLIDEGDRGDLSHFSPTAGGVVRASAARSTVVEAGPLRARLRIEQDFALPIGLRADCQWRTQATRTATIVTEITVVAGERRVEFATTFTNEVPDHRLRALFHLPFSADRVDVDHGLAVAERPVAATPLGSDSERPDLCGPHHLFVDVSDGQRGAALLTRGLPEHEVLCPPGERTVLALTLLRSIGWLDPPRLATPAAQELGAHRFEYALLLHPGGWEAGAVLGDAQRYVAPPRTFTPGGTARVAASRSLVELSPSSLVLLAAYPSAAGIVLRLLNAAPRSRQATVRPAFSFREALAIDPLERPLTGAAASGLTVSENTARVHLRPWQIYTLLLRL